MIGSAFAMGNLGEGGEKRAVYFRKIKVLSTVLLTDFRKNMTVFLSKKEGFSICGKYTNAVIYTSCLDKVENGMKERREKKSRNGIPYY